MSAPTLAEAIAGGEAVIASYEALLTGRGSVRRTAQPEQVRRAIAEMRLLLEAARDGEKWREALASPGLYAGMYCHCGDASPLVICNQCGLRITPEAELVALVGEMAIELEAEINERYDADHPDGIHPALVRRYERDMDTVRRARAAIRKAVGE